MTLVKICGIRDLCHARVAAEAGADLIGFVFVSVRRQVSPEAARDIVRSVRTEFDRPPATIGLFVNEHPDEINRIVKMVGLDLVQLHGDETPELAAQIDVPTIKAIRLDATRDVDQAHGEVEPFLQSCAGVLLDSHVPGQWGGTGVVGNWDVAAELAREFPLFLAGGLSPMNVPQAIQDVRPTGVDVSSGVETDGHKDAEKIREFINAARDVECEVKQPESAAPFVNLIEMIRAQRPLVNER